MTPPASYTTVLQAPSIEGVVAPSTPLLTRRVRPRPPRRWRYTSQSGELSRASRLVAVDWKATQCGLLCTSPSTEGLVLSPFACEPSLATLTRSIEPPSPLR